MITQRCNTRLTIGSMILMSATVLADSIEIGPLDPPGLDSATGIALRAGCFGSDAWIIDGLGQTIWRIELNDASIEETRTLDADSAPTRGLDFDWNSESFLTHRRVGPVDDMLARVDPHTGEVQTVGLTGTDFNFLSLADDPLNRTLWLVTDHGGGELYSVSKQDGSATLLRGYDGALGQPSALAAGPNGELFVASLDGNIYRIFADSPDVVLVTSTGLSGDDRFVDFDYGPYEQRWYGVEERRRGKTRTWHLREITGLPADCLPCDVNADGAINAWDIEAMLDQLFTECVYSLCGGEINGDGVIDAFDIEPFLDCLFP